MDEVPNNMATKGFAAGEAARSVRVPLVETGPEAPAYAPFDIITDGTNQFMYVPQYSVRVNGNFITPTGLYPEGTLADWYDITSINGGIVLFLKFSDADGEAGLVTGATFGLTPPSGLWVDIPITDHIGGRHVTHQSGQVCWNQFALDSDGGSSTMKSLTVPYTAGGVLAGSNFTAEVGNFRAGTSPAGCLLDSEDSYSHKIGVREHDGTCAEMRWVNDTDLAEAVGNWLVDNCSWVCDGGCSDEFCLTTEFISWYCSLDPAPFLEDSDLCGKFWERGEDACVNYGSAIGDSCQAEVIDLDGKDLVGDWTAENSLGVCGNLTVNGCAYFCFIDTVNIYACQWNGIFFDFCTTNGIVYWH